MKRVFLIILLVLNSCLGQKENKHDKKVKNMEASIQQITCFLKTLDGDKEIYRIVNDSIYYFNKERKLTTDRFLKLKSMPEIIIGKDTEIGCGVCSDGVDYKFVFNTEGEETTWTIEPGSAVQPKEVADYFKVLMSLYEEAVKK